MGAKRFSLNWPQRNGQFWLKTVFLRFCIGAMTKTTTMSKTKTKTTTTKTMKTTTANMNTTKTTITKTTTTKKTTKKKP